MADKQKIDTSRPVRLIGYDKDHQAGVTEVRGDSILGYVYNATMRWDAMWDEFGEPIGDTMLYGSIENVPDEPERDLVAEQKQIEANEIAEFRDIVRYYVEKKLCRTYDPSFHGRFEVGVEVGFVQLNHKHGEWEVWDLCDGCCPKHGTLPPFIPAEEVGYFWNWLRERESIARDYGAKRGFEDGCASFQRKLQDLAGFNPNKFQPRNEDY